MFRPFCLTVVVIFMLLTITGCGSKDQTKLDAIQRFDKLPKSTQRALLAKNLVGMSTWCSTSNPSATSTQMALIDNGAVRAKSEKAADLVVMISLNLSGTTNIVIRDHAGNTFIRPTYPFNSGWWFGREIANTIGTERKVALLNQ